MNDTPTPRTDALRTKLHVNINTPNIVKYMETILHANTLETELTAAREEIERLQCSGIHSCHDNCERPNCVLRREIKAVTEQRDRLAEALQKVSTSWNFVEVAREALQSLNQPTEP